MFVPYIQMMDNEQFVSRWVRSLVRLHLIEDLSQFRGYAGRDLRAAPSKAIGGRRDIKDREIRVVRWLSARSDNGLPSEMIKRCSEIVNRVAEGCAQNGV